MWRNLIQTVNRLGGSRGVAGVGNSTLRIHHRRLVCEALEERRLLSIGPNPDPPNVPLLGSREDSFSSEATASVDSGLDPLLETLSSSTNPFAAPLTGVIDGHPVSIDRHDAPSQPIDNSVQTWLIIHGWNSSPARFDDLASEIRLETDGDQILTLDWSEIAGVGITPSYSEAHIVDVAIWASSALTAHGFTGPLLNLAGHSHGAYVAAEMAERITGGVNTIVGLDPAEDWFGGYNPEDPGEIDFAGHSSFSWAFSDAGGAFGSEVTPGSAHEAFAVENTGHSEVVDLFWNMLRDVGNSVVLQYFALSRLLSYTPGPWLEDQYDHSGNPSISGTFEAVITAEPGGVVAQSIDFVSVDTTSQIGVHRVIGGAGVFLQDYNGNGSWDAGDRALPFGAGTDTPIIGDWSSFTSIAADAQGALAANYVGEESWARLSVKQDATLNQLYDALAFELVRINDVNDGDQDTKNVASVVDFLYMDSDWMDDVI